jgi:ABC-type transport system involved in multi-copper enzyme maturation permease subunit
LVQRALKEIDTKPAFPLALSKVWYLILTQARLMRSDLWTASAVVMAIGIIVSVIAERANVLQFVAPMVAAACLAVIYGPENDPALELTLSTPTSPWKILLARLTVVSGYNLILTIVASLIMITIIPADMLQTLILSWFGPLTFLSALALLLSIWMGSSNAVTIVYGLWLTQFFEPLQIQIGKATPALEMLLTAYRQFWQNSLFLVMLSLLFIGLALWSANRMEAASQKHAA